MILILVPRPPRLGPFLDDESLPLAKNFGLDYEQWWINPPCLIPSVPRQAITDQDDGAKLANFSLEHEQWWINPPQTFLTNKPPITDTDERVVPPAFQGEEDLWRQLVTWPVAPPAPAKLDDGDLPNAKYFLIDEDYWWTAQRESLPSVPLQTFTDDEVLAILNTDEDFWWLPPYRGYTVPLQAVTDDETLPNANNFGLEDDLWTVGSMALWRLPLIPSSTDEDVWPTAPTGFPGEEELWLRFTVWPVLPPSVILDDEVLANAKNFALDEDVYHVSLAFRQSLIRQALTDTDELSFGAAPSIVEDDIFLAVSPILPTWNLRLPQGEDDALPLLGIDEDYPWIARQQTWPALPIQARLDDEVLPQAKNFFLDEDLWWVPSYRGTTVPTLLLDTDAYASPARIGLIDVFTVRCARTKPVTVSGAQTQPATVRVTKTINSPVTC